MPEIAKITALDGVTYDIKDALARQTIGSVTLDYTAWTGNGPYTQVVTVSGATITSNSKVDIQPDATAIQQMITDECAAIYIDNNNGTLTAYAVGSAPTANLTVQVTVMEVS